MQNCCQYALLYISRHDQFLLLLEVYSDFMPLFITFTWNTKNTKQANSQVNNTEQQQQHSETKIIDTHVLNENNFRIKNININKNKY